MSTNQTKLIGLSFSNCVLHIAKGYVNIKDVDRIIAATRCATPEEWEEVIKDYKEYDWSGWDANAEDSFADRAEKIGRQLLAEGRVKQPRLSEGKIAAYNKNNGGCWVTSEDDIWWNTTTIFPF